MSDNPPDTKAPSNTPNLARGELRKRDLAILCLGAVLGTSLYSAFMPEPLAKAPTRVVVSASPTPCVRLARSRAPGTRIDVEWHGSYYAASVLRMAQDGRARIHYEGYGPEWDEDVTEDRIRDVQDDRAE